MAIIISVILRTLNLRDKNKNENVKKGRNPRLGVLIGHFNDTNFECSLLREAHQYDG